MTPEEIGAAYDALNQEVTDYAAAEAAKVGNSQRSLGTLAERVASPSGQTSGLANYTYNRAMRPTVDTTAAAIATIGKSMVLSQMTNDALREAKLNYQNAQRNYQKAYQNAVANANKPTTNLGQPIIKNEKGKELKGTGNYGSGGDNSGDNSGNTDNSSNIGVDENGHLKKPPTAFDFPESQIPGLDGWITVDDWDERINRRINGF